MAAADAGARLSSWGYGVAAGERKLESIFVSVASYRDPLCRQTVLSALRRAAEPRRVFVGVVQQHEDGVDAPCLLPHA